jgi:hypothetical protein
MVMSRSAGGLRRPSFAAVSRNTKSGRGISGERGRHVSALASRKAVCKLVSLINYVGGCRVNRVGGSESYRTPTLHSNCRNFNRM